MPTTSLPVPVLLGAALLCFGSTRIAPAEPAAVAISKDFLPALEAAPTLDGWEQHMDALIYLVSVDDVDAKRVGRKMIPFVQQAGTHYKEFCLSRRIGHG